VSVPVETIRLDDCFGDYDGRLDSTKRIQAAEVMALRGMATTLARHPNASMVLEYWPQGLRRAGTERRGAADPRRAVRMLTPGK
jgi:hypothetical protein